ncbi:MAG: hypothetical protein KF709_07145 [Gemmatimonadaceae bacterium]|nr:hypothetical protein [Gemmatimonadaceae bacterium]
MVSRLVAALFVLLGVLPLAEWIPGGERDPEFFARWLDWGSGFGLCAGLGALGWYLSARREAGAPVAEASPPELSGVAPSGDNARDWRFAAILAGAALVLYAGIALVVFDGRPLLIDEIVHVLQARDYAAGHLFQPVREPREFYSIFHWVDVGAKSYGQYPPGGPAMLVPGVWLGAEWIVGPVAGALCVLLFHALLLAVEPDASQRFRRWSLVLFATAPFGAFMFGSHMNHATSLVWLLAAAVALAQATRPGASPWWGLATGLALGVAATIRPLDAGAFALPAGAWLAWRARAGRQEFAGWLLSGVGVALPMALMFWVNVQTTGHPLQFGYDLLWGTGHAIGFHEAPWGDAHTPARGVELLALYVTQLGTYLFESPFPSTLFAVLGLWFAAPPRAADRYLLSSVGLLALGYWAYWHDGYYLGPRFLFAAYPALILWSSRGLRELLRRTAQRRHARRGVVVFLGATLALSALSIVAVRLPAYSNHMYSMRLDPDEASARAGVRDALVLVQESWGARIVVQLWAAGVPRPSVERLYRRVDTCRLSLALDYGLSQDLQGAALESQLLPLVADSAFVELSGRSPDHTERVDARLRYPPSCEREIAEDVGGYTLYAPWRVSGDGNVYLRWMPGREAEASRAFPGRPVYRVRRAGPAFDAPLVWTRISVDSTSGAP